jgi:hypothetical protein
MRRRKRRRRRRKRRRRMRRMRSTDIGSCSRMSSLLMTRIYVGRPC